jgi:hypothetical protein
VTEDTAPRVRTAWSDPDHMRLVYDLEERRNDKKADRLREADPDDPWAIQPGDDCGILPAGEGEPDA